MESVEIECHFVHVLKIAEARTDDLVVLVKAHVHLVDVRLGWEDFLNIFDPLIDLKCDLANIFLVRRIENIEVVAAVTRAFAVSFIMQNEIGIFENRLIWLVISFVAILSRGLSRTTVQKSELFLTDFSEAVISLT